jgi:hypothetical protein
MRPKSSLAQKLLALCRISGIKVVFFGVHESATSDWWKEVRERIQHSLLNFPQGFEQQTLLNLLADQDALELVCEPFSDLEPNLAVYQALRKLFLS